MAILAKVSARPFRARSMCSMASSSNDFAITLAFLNNGIILGLATCIIQENQATFAAKPQREKGNLGVVHVKTLARTRRTKHWCHNLSRCLGVSYFSCSHRVAVLVLARALRGFSEVKPDTYHFSVANVASGVFRRSHRNFSSRLHSTGVAASTSAWYFPLSLKTHTTPTLHMESQPREP